VRTGSGWMEHSSEPRRHDRLIPGWVDALSVAVECSVPTGVILAHILLGAVAPYVAVSSPSIRAYGLLITLTTMRLRPGLCLLGGAVAACELARVGGRRERGGREVSCAENSPRKAEGEEEECEEAERDERPSRERGLGEREP